jgi:hypothetical protein
MLNWILVFPVAAMIIGALGLLLTIAISLVLLG